MLKKQPRGAWLEKLEERARGQAAYSSFSPSTLQLSKDFFFFYKSVHQQVARWHRETHAKFLGVDDLTYIKGHRSTSSQMCSIEQAVNTMWSRGGIS